ncbi:hypothetical protein [Microbacterium enclense]|uniref:hypothetical protein n=1 Tax=Microbacterium enclense TaxID=993073 RepID=UPI003D7222D0
MSEETPIRRAYDLGMDHADEDHAGKPDVRLHSGREIARALGFTATTGEQLVELREAYNDGWRDWA